MYWAVLEVVGQFWNVVLGGGQELMVKIVVDHGEGLGVCWGEWFCGLAVEFMVFDVCCEDSDN